jgi:hypothetical protein
MLGIVFLKYVINFLEIPTRGNASLSIPDRDNNTDSLNGLRIHVRFQYEERIGFSIPVKLRYVQYSCVIIFSWSNRGCGRDARMLKFYLLGGNETFVPYFYYIYLSLFEFSYCLNFFVSCNVRLWC